MKLVYSLTIILVISSCTSINTSNNIEKEQKYSDSTIVFSSTSEQFPYKHFKRLICRTIDNNWEYNIDNNREHTASDIDKECVVRFKVSREGMIYDENILKSSNNSSPGNNKLYLKDIKKLDPEAEFLTAFFNYILDRYDIPTSFPLSSF